MRILDRDLKAGADPVAWGRGILETGMHTIGDRETT
jgi:hypothetical protein